MLGDGAAGSSVAAIEPKIVDMSPGFRMTLDERDPLQRWMAVQRVYEPEVSWIYPYLLTSGDVAIDGGAHIGYLSLLMARCVGERGAVHSFEPIPHTFERLRANVALNPWAHIHAQPVALGERAGRLAFEVPIDPQGTSLLAWGATSVQLRRGRSVERPVVRLDDYAADHGIGKVKVLKLDLEGTELAAINGAGRLLKEGRVSYLVCELNQFLLDAQGLRYDGVRAAVAPYGYRPYRLGKDARVHPIEGEIRRPHMIMGDVLFARTGPPA